MKLQLLSDLHFEFFDEMAIEGFIEDVSLNADVLVLAGDIAPIGYTLAFALRHFCHYNSRVIYIAGNHELTPHRTFRDSLQKELPELAWLDRSSFDVDSGPTILGATLWFPNSPSNVFHEKRMSDFRVIPEFKKWVYQEHAADYFFFQKYLTSDSIAVSHHLPSERSVAERFRGNELNRFFVSSMDSLIERQQPLLWLHGHTHDSVDYCIGRTRVVANPYGYRGVELNPNFNPHLVIEV